MTKKIEGNEITTHRLVAYDAKLIGQIAQRLDVLCKPGTFAASFVEQVLAPRAPLLLCRLVHANQHPQCLLLVL
jgi:hypothetical protein